MFRNDEITVEGIAELRPDRLVLSPGPCTPNEAGVCVPAIQALRGRVPILGVCLGHQSIGAALGGRIVRAQQLMHGKASTIATDEQGLYAGLPREFSVIRYHSLVIERDSLPARTRGHGHAPTTARSWACAIASSRSRACSSIPSPSCPNTGMRCCATS